MARVSIVSDEVILAENKKAIEIGISRAKLAENLGMEQGTLASRLTGLRKKIREQILAVRPDIKPEKLEAAIELQCPLSKTRVHGRPSAKKTLVKNLADEALALLDADDSQNQES